MRCAILIVLLAVILPVDSHAADPIRNDATEQAKLMRNLPDGGLPPVVGVRNIQIFRATKDAIDLSDGKGWTYNHHIDLACWKGRLYVAWDNGQTDEDVWPARQVYSTSDDGVKWSPPIELFPQGMTTSLRAYFFHAPNKRMLVMAGLRVSQEKLMEANKGGAVVREIKPDHTLGDVYLLIPAKQNVTAPPLFRESTDKEFVQACEQLLANRTFLEQQDYGVLLRDRAMPYHAKAVDNEQLADFGKAFCFFHRKDGALVGIGKKTWTVVSTDEGNSWSQPVQLQSLITGNAKVWGTRTSDGRYALVYNPSRTVRYPLVMTTGDDGIAFKDMRIVHGEVPRQRYAGLNRSVGPQYIRGISEWAGDGSWKDDGALWVVYSGSKEDIWVSRIPIPAKTTGWSTYSPEWAPVTEQAGAIQLEDRDPYDYARAQYSFPEAKTVSVKFKVQPSRVKGSKLEIDLCSMFGGALPVQITFNGDGQITSVDRKEPLGVFAPEQWVDVEITANAESGKYSVRVDGNEKITDAPLIDKADAFQRISFRTGDYRGIGRLEPVAAGSDKPVEAAKFGVKDISVR